ncbi:MAG: glutamate--tRNA ligase [Rickettsiales bacterium]
MAVVTRFAPSPTGLLHIGGARTALFNWLYARGRGGKFLLRIEDTDKARSTETATKAILSSLSWLGLDWDGEPVHQSARERRHKQVAEALLKSGKAYYCYSTPEELAARREESAKEGKVYVYPNIWRDKEASHAPVGALPSVRLKTPLCGKALIDDKVQGKITIDYADMEDFVILRSDGTPTYMLAVVVDDRDMGVNTIIRGDDHLTNSFKQQAIYEAMGWEVPTLAHVPLIHGPDGAKMSKRHGAASAEAYRDMGYLPEALRNYLARLGWSHGDDEIFSSEQAMGWFGFDGMGKSPSRFDLKKLDHVNGHYIRDADDEYLTNLVLPYLPSCDAAGRARLLNGMSSLKQRASTLKELAEKGAFYVSSPKERTPQAEKALEGSGRTLLGASIAALESVADWHADRLQEAMKEFCEKAHVKLGDAMAPVRAAITGSHAAPSMFEAMEILGREESLKRLYAA